MGIENRIKQQHGKKYWDENKEDILKKANRYDILYQEEEYPNCKQRRTIRRAVKMGIFTEVDQTLLEEYIKTEKIKTNPMKVLQ